MLDNKTNIKDYKYIDKQLKEETLESEVVSIYIFYLNYINKLLYFNFSDIFLHVTTIGSKFNAPECSGKDCEKIVKSKLLMQNSCETPCQMLISLTV